MLTKARKLAQYCSLRQTFRKYGIFIVCYYPVKVFSVLWFEALEYWSLFMRLSKVTKFRWFFSWQFMVKNDVTILCHYPFENKICLFVHFEGMVVLGIAFESILCWVLCWQPSVCVKQKDRSVIYSLTLGRWQLFSFFFS